jgi:hypothetical protein
VLGRIGRPLKPVWTAASIMTIIHRREKNNSLDFFMPLPNTNTKQTVE